MAEDKLICYLEIDLDEICMKIGGQTHTTLMKIFRWRLPLCLSEDTAVVDAINRFDDKLARLLLPFANNIANRRSLPLTHVPCSPTTVVMPTEI